MKHRLLPALLITVGCASSPADPSGSSATPTASARLRLNPQQPVTKLAFGSCLDQTRPHPILGDVVAARPDAMVLLGDNVYADAGSRAELVRAYEALGESSAYQRMVSAVPVLAAWDDHDYGRNDVGKEFELKEMSKTVMLDFFGEPKDSPRRAREGNYDAVIVGPQDQRVQILLLDTRWFRDPLLAGGVAKRYLPHRETGPTILGDAQWTWLERQLQEPADVRIIVTSIQLVVSEHPFEGWGLFPAERRKMFDTIARTDAHGVVFVSGDRHRGELSCVYDETVGYPLLELTASSLNRPNHKPEDNRFRLPSTPSVGDENFGVIAIDWSQRSLRIALHGLGGDTRIETSVSLEALAPGRGPKGVPGCAPSKV